MKKLKLDLKDVGEILTREQLKQVVGGSGERYCHYTCVVEFNNGTMTYSETDKDQLCTTESDCSAKSCESYANGGSWLLSVSCVTN